jgi:anti-sigma factor RsiW
MNCDQAIEILPWFLNDTLEAGERQEVQRHLETCSRCQEALAETQGAWRIFGQHLPTETLVALAYGETPADLDPALVERHLASCPQCAAELEMVNTSRRLEEDGKIAVFPGKPRRQPRETENYRGWRATALAASLAGLVAVSGWVHSARQAERFEAGLASQAQGRGGQTEIASAGTHPQAAAFLSVSPDEAVERGKAGQVADLPAGAPESVLALGSPRPSAFHDYDVEIRDAGTAGGSGSGSSPLFTVHGVQRNQDGYYTLSVPRGSLKPGAYTIRVFGVEGSRREALETYSVRQP